MSPLAGSDIPTNLQVISRKILSDCMASVASGVTSSTKYERELELEKLNAEVILQEEVTKLAAKRLAVQALKLENEIKSASSRSWRTTSSMRSPDIRRPEKIAKINNGGGGPPHNGPDPDDADVKSDSSPLTMTRPSDVASPALVNLDDVLKDVTSRVKPVITTTTLVKESLI